MNYDDHKPPEPDDMRVYPCGQAGFDWDLTERRYQKIREMADLEEMVWELDFSPRSWQGGPWADDEDLRRRR
jgi:hypothetical protein